MSPKHKSPSQRNKPHLRVVGRNTRADEPVRIGQRVHQVNANGRVLSEQVSREIETSWTRANHTHPLQSSDAANLFGSFVLVGAGRCTTGQKTTTATAGQERASRKQAWLYRCRQRRRDPHCRAQRLRDAADQTSTHHCPRVCVPLYRWRAKEGQ